MPSEHIDVSQISDCIDLATGLIPKFNQEDMLEYAIFMNGILEKHIKEVSK